MTTTSTTSQARIDANRRNSARSTGPRSPQGKQRASLNALKHGLTAHSVVLPDEDPEVLQARVDAWKDNLQPADEIQDYLIERAAHASWQLDRADRTIAARLSARILAAPADRAAQEAEEVADLGRKLFWDRIGHLALYPHTRTDDGAIRISRSLDPDDPLEPAIILARLEATAAGCRWLLDRWADLRAILEDGLTWQGPDRFRATRLLGQQPMEALDDRRLMTIHLACRAMEPEGPAAFADLKPELQWHQEKAFAARVEGRGAAGRMPESPSAGRAALLALIDGATARLRVLLSAHEEAAEAVAALGGDLDAFDESREGELLRRYQLGKAREFHRAVDAFYKARREAKRHAEEESTAADETNPTPSEVPAGSGFAHHPEAPDPVVADDPPAAARAEPAARRPDETNPTAEPMAAAHRPDETNPTPGSAPAPGGTGPDSPQSPDWYAELDRLEIEAIGRMDPLELLRVLGLAAPQ